MTQNLTQNVPAQNLTKDDFRIRLLIVDDEQTIRRLCMTVGESLGFVCLEAESGEIAQDDLRRRCLRVERFT